MRKNDKYDILFCIASLTDEQLKDYFYETLFECLGSQAQTMYERGYDIEDVRERARFEKYLLERHDFVSLFCSKRGIDIDL